MVADQGIGAMEAAATAQKQDALAQSADVRRKLLAGASETESDVVYRPGMLAGDETPERQRQPEPPPVARTLIKNNPENVMSISLWA